jgi:hypothetical protein
MRMTISFLALLNRRPSNAEPDTDFGEDLASAALTQYDKAMGRLA